MAVDRKINHKEDSFDPALESILWEWATWSIDLKNNQVGWPPQSPLVEVIEVGISCPNFGPREPRLNPRAMKVSRWMVRLRSSFPTNADAVEAYYSHPKMPLRVLAEERGISIRTFKSRVYSGKVWLSGRMAAEGENDAVISAN